MNTTARRVVAEFVGTALLLAAVIGSGVMAERLAQGQLALALLANTAATAAALVALIATFGPISGAHFNPVVSLMFAWRGELAARALPLYLLAQLVGAISGAILAHAMFGLPLIDPSTKARPGLALALSEMVATAGLLAVIWVGTRTNPAQVPFTVAAWIAGAYWFTASTSFANPAVTIARALSDTFAGIAPADAPLFIAAQLVAAALAIGMLGWLSPPGRQRS